MEVRGGIERGKEEREGERGVVRGEAEERQ